MRTLLLLRHAKSSWDDASISDHERPLAARGRRAAPKMGRFMADEGLVPEWVLCSTAVRTRETWALIAPLLGSPPVEYDRQLYLASAATLLNLVRRLPDEVSRVLMVGHNPGTETLASGLADDESSSGLDRLRHKFPTGALAVLTTRAGHWADVSAGACRLERFVRPADLPDADGT